MPECWLQPNRRVIGLSLVGPLLLLCVSAFLFLSAMRDEVRWILFFLASLSAMLAAVWGGYLIRCWRTARLAYEDGELLVGHGTGKPMRVPIGIVEVFFLGSGPAIPDHDEEHGPRTANVVVRLAEAAREWHHREFPPVLGKWEEGYIVLRGTWCEPIGHERLNVMNARLAEIRRQRRGANELSKEIDE